MADERRQQAGRVVVFGAAGQVGRELVARLGAAVVPLTRRDVDLADARAVVAALEDRRPAVVVNAAAYTQVDQAEAEPGLAFAVNAAAPGVVAGWCARHGAALVHYSTDHVFSGTGDRAYTEDDEPDPINVYGRTKLAGERRIADAGGRWLVLRTSWVYSARGRNFLTAMLRLGAQREVVRVVADRWSAPTCATHLAGATASLVARLLAGERLPSGVVHVAGAGVATPHEFAAAIFAGARCHGLPLRLRDLQAIRDDEYPAAAARPRNARLDTRAARRRFGLRLPHWRAALAECLAGGKEELDALCAA
ncbi:dTDP-4-dehydrorhamnose reductase [Nannocystis radixulma]|uniref:dTDP-4-dehydrorhamnose reductase n=1 Tax=Nannocystis radixulma TaxID=2995305 RepID=A0ABT5AYA6_9BACT|nr:dTDP-4-dehydrorhamnose reductase [Nannocystis radixulma]MDC0666203.1 dTDP-4-dehydrorhamnose reductase [Nannocystis radixulma]